MTDKQQQTTQRFIDPFGEGLEQFLGLTLCDAKKLVAEVPGNIRIITDGSTVTQDYNPARINLKITNGRVNSAYYG